MPEDIKALYATAFEVDTVWLIEAGARRQKWIDQAQSLNIYMAGASGKKLDETYKLAWTRGLKTTYYLRTISATQAEKSTVTRSRPAQRGVLRRGACDGGAGSAGRRRRARTAGHERSVLRHRRPRLRGLPVIEAAARTCIDKFARHVFDVVAQQTLRE